MNLNKGCIEIRKVSSHAYDLFTMNLNKGCIEIFYDQTIYVGNKKDEP